MAGSEKTMAMNGSVASPSLQEEGKGGKRKPNYSILLYVPNLIGYTRLLLLLLAFCLLPASPASFVTLYSISITLDGFDGYAARKLHQCSLFGAWFDVILDNLGRGLLWVHIHPMLYLVSAVEWIAFVCNYSFGAKWRESLIEGPKAPTIVTHILANNFRNAWGVWVIAGLHVLPVWLLGIKYNIFESHLWFLPLFVQPLGFLLLGTGRLLCLSVELWSIWNHMYGLLVNSSSC
ncbi:uncharacterized protein LOC125024933 [Penaeus chinensis]|uniref:uncharacterized protein LOC125024933 n=1 Tax=Penaeus chinensis TaxID=139456 RepID=UPI001FB664A9|nr:uncharacterized protein LOC125024933 [Penaeus chinensis]XP_047468672.1 uncharacterized protein LOC125024933 [Penaeus chinensis]XP_047468673.1 uncharacterized protein LOC125024933 [Penaeus chinensis]